MVEKHKKHDNYGVCAMCIVFYHWVSHQILQIKQYWYLFGIIAILFLNTYSSEFYIKSLHDTLTHLHTCTQTKGLRPATFYINFIFMLFYFALGKLTLNIFAKKACWGENERLGEVFSGQGRVFQRCCNTLYCKSLCVWSLRSYKLFRSPVTLCSVCLCFCNETHTR